MKPRRKNRWLLLVALAAMPVPGVPGSPSEGIAAAAQQAAGVDAVEDMVRRALDYDQGDRDSLTDAREEFTPDGWSEFMAWLDGYVDGNGAPTGSSRFSPSGDAAVERGDRGVTHITIPGTLKQQARNAYGGLSSTTYRVVIDVQLASDPPKIRHMETITCGRRSTNPACR